MQVLEVGALAALRHEDRRFTTREVGDLFSVLRIPLPANLSTSLRRLAEQQLVMRPSKDSWALTAAGEDRLIAEAAHVPTLSLAAELADFAGADFGKRRHALIPPFLAPAGIETGLQRLLASSSFDTNIMLITRYPADAGDSFGDLITRLRTATAHHGLTLQLASDGNAEDTLWANVVTYMWGSKYAIVLMDSADGALNSNVLIEIGGMLVTGRRCAILRDVSVPTMPTDLVGHIYKPVDLKDHGAVVDVVHLWLTNDLQLPSCPQCPSLDGAARRHVS